MFEPVPDDLSSPRDSRKQLVDGIGSDCFQQRGGAGPEWRGGAGLPLCRQGVTPSSAGDTRGFIRSGINTRNRKRRVRHVQRSSACWSDSDTGAAGAR